MRANNMKHTYLIKGSLIVLLTCLVSIMVIRYMGITPIGNQPLRQLAVMVVEKCATSPYHPSCYDTEIPLLMRKISMEDAFMVTKYIQEQDASYGYCHVLGHKLSAIETLKNPQNWKDVITRCPSGVCSNGCVHGAFQERFRSDKIESEAQIQQLKHELSDVCEARGSWSPSGIEQGSCYHAVGHLLMYVVNAEIPKALALCDELVVKGPDRDYSQLCYDGVFMQLFQPLEPEDFALIKGKEITVEKHRNFCAAYTGKAHGSCWSEGWPLHVNELQTPEGLVSFCSYLSGVENERCYRAMVYVIVPRLNLDVGVVSDFCSGLPVAHQPLCFSDAATRFMEIDYKNVAKGVDICDHAKIASVKEACYEELAKMANYNFRPDAPEKQQLCAVLPPQWQAACAQ